MRIAIDIDEVLCPFFHPMVRRRGKAVPTKPHPYVYRKALNITEEESSSIVREFYTSEEFKNLPIIKYSDYALYQLKGREHVLYAVTGRQSVARDTTETWLNTHFPSVFQDLVMTNSFTPKEIPKSHLCSSLNLNAIIDDSFETCRDCKNEGLEAIHFVGAPLYPWCHVTDPDVIRVSNWLEVLNEFPLVSSSNSPSDCADTDPMCLIPDDPNRTPLLPARRRTQVEPPW